MERLEEYEQAVRDSVASACIDRADDGTCAPPAGQMCALELNLREIVKAVKAVKSERIDEYAESIRENVCMHCINQNLHGECYYRDHLDCCLDNFMLLVVDAIEAVDEHHCGARDRMQV